MKNKTHFRRKNRRGLLFSFFWFLVKVIADIKLLFQRNVKYVFCRISHDQKNLLTNLEKPLNLGRHFYSDSYIFRDPNPFFITYCSQFFFFYILKRVLNPP